MHIISASSVRESEQKKSVKGRTWTKCSSEHIGNDSLISAFLFMYSTVHQMKCTRKARERKKIAQSNRSTHMHTARIDFVHNMLVLDAINSEWYENMTRKLLWRTCWCWCGCGCWYIHEFIRHITNWAAEVCRVHIFLLKHISLTFCQWLLLTHNQISPVLLVQNAICHKFISIIATATTKKQEKNEPKISKWGATE